MKSILLLIIICSGTIVFSQFHDRNIMSINTVNEAQAYAERYREVSFGIVNSELDVFLFDKVNVSNLSASVGSVNTIYKRRTKFLKDTIVTMLNVQVVSFDEQKVSLAEAHTTIEDIKRRYMSGTSYWNLMKEFQSEKCSFIGGPISTDKLKERYGDDFLEMERDTIFKWSKSRDSEYPVLIIIHQEAHDVPAFYAISYNVAG